MCIRDSSYGDLSENSEYDDAKNEQAMLEARIATVEVTLKNAVIIDESNICLLYTSSFRNIEVVFKETLNCKKCFLVEALD